MTSLSYFLLPGGLLLLGSVGWGLEQTKFSKKNSTRLFLSKCSSLDLKEIKVLCGEELGVGFPWSDPGILQDPLSPKPQLELGDIHVERDAFNRVLNEGAFFGIPNFP